MIPSTTNGHASRSTESRESYKFVNPEPCMVKLCFVVCVARFFRPSGPYQPSCLAPEGTARGANWPCTHHVELWQFFLRPCFAGIKEQRVRAVYAPLIEICCAAYNTHTTTTTPQPSPLYLLTGFAEVDKNPPIRRNTKSNVCKIRTRILNNPRKKSKKLKIPPS